MPIMASNEENSPTYERFPDEARILLTVGVWLGPTSDISL